jgi:hypothetical protein
MTVKDLNTSVNFNYENGLIVYLDKVNKTFRFISDDNAVKRGLTHSIKNKDDYAKLSKQYKIDVSMADWIKISNMAKKQNDNDDFRDVLAAMHKDVLNIARENR